MADASNEGANISTQPNHETEGEKALPITTEEAEPVVTVTTGIEDVGQEQVSSSEILQQQQPVPPVAPILQDVADSKRPRLDEDGDTSPSGLSTKRQRVTDDTEVGKSIMEKLKTETEQMIENPEKALLPDPIPPGVVGISTFHDNDVLSGRGGGTNVHPGNRNFRDLINLNRRLYLKARKNDKPAISRAIVRSIRNNHGRFLKKDEKSGQWFEIGDDAAREKTSQALRQRAPEMRKLLFDTEREEARVATESHMRQQQQQMLAGMPSPQNGAGVLPSMTPGMPPMAMHPGMMYTPGMMIMNPALFMTTQPQQQQQSSQGTSTGNATSLQPTMTPMMMDPYQQAAMFQTALMANPAMMMNPMVQLQQAAALSVSKQTSDAGGATPAVVTGTTTQGNAVSSDTFSHETSATTMDQQDQNNEAPDQHREQVVVIASEGAPANSDRNQNIDASEHEEACSEEQVLEI